MKVLIVNNAVPFVWGGAEELASNVSRRLNAVRGVQSEVLRIPFSWTPKEQLIAEILMNQNFRIHNTDRVIALKFPAYLVPHANKTLWLLHQFRQAYDLLDAGASHLDRTEDHSILQAIKTADDNCFESCRHIFTNSPVTQARLKHYNERSSEVLYPPLNDPEFFQPGELGDYVFAGGRVDLGKRQHLLIEAMAAASPQCRLVIAGPVSDPSYANRLQELVTANHLTDRVTLQMRLHTRQELGTLAANALACAYIPFDEDSLGYVTMEAAEAGRAIITASDSGGVLELVENQSNGYVCAASAKALADALDRVFTDRNRTRLMGGRSRELWRSKNISWDKTLERLLD
ncbi:GDP-mannose-dependent alpha-(1-6)-phosphatidylinositol monomannoside mannosyltransferase [Variibacter gotjawalensis]|uniref:GDP-mannose-dependent alpha-(1-6)-phosphatidylinositol monomannoside mannosyltransferase n=1 Tax=Variibacter gotjawalensis TaxID=1333996 RepID=A0A0S3PNS0_9BRAD|nr:glycosyltransferase family 4 protein [Variibacter gotjawalensis]NIK47882.1 glycosyltransferase involved in cell wall biosynthesis [Variibacter gotjawalensis]RZS49761.1 glycosyltransferase involved in cell wall biosynthesis [Variibacter gotjawalensis]BAT57590.1 GDP-mannose-dependent alpha-(1-6)-phosphatidylinositol monomannoside mannosyltransferase [Variibacter gotjawalensis]